MAHDVFVSYSAKDKAVADAVVAGLEQEGLRCWIAPRDVLPGTTWGEAIVDAIEAARVMVLILSENSNRSRQVLREVERAVASDTIIIPFRIEAIDPSGAMAYFLATEHWLDALSPPLEDHIARLTFSVRTLMNPDNVSAPVGSAHPATNAPASATPAFRPPGGMRRLLIGGLAIVAITAGVVIVALVGADDGASETGRVSPSTSEQSRTGEDETAPDGSPAASGQEATARFEDQFQGALDGGWQWVLEDPDSWTLTRTPGWLQITALDVQRNTLLRDAPDGPYQIETAVRFRPTSNFQAAGVRVGPASGSGVTWVQIARGYCDPEIAWCIGDGVYFEDFEDGESLTTVRTLELPEGTDIVYLRILADGDSYRGFTSTDGTSWRLVGEFSGSFVDERVGLVAHRAFEEPLEAEFDYFTLTSPPPESPLPSFEEILATYPEGQTCNTTADVIGQNPDGSLKIGLPPGTVEFDGRLELPCWGLRLTVLAGTDILGTSYPAGTVLALGADSDPAVVVDETGEATWEAVGGFNETWIPADGLTFVSIEP